MDALRPARLVPDRGGTPAWAALAAAVALSAALSACTAHAAPRPAGPAVHTGSPVGRHVVVRPAAATRLRVATAAWSLPGPLSREVVLAVSGNLLVAGGLDAAGASTSAVEVLDPRTGTVRSRGRLIAAVHDAAGVLLHGRTFVFGGGDADVVAADQEVRAASSAHVVGRLPRRRADLVAVSAGDVAYVLGGYDGAALDRSVLVTRDGLRFSRLATLPVPVRYPAVAFAAHALWLFGGQAASGPSDVIQRIDPHTGRATVAAHLPAALAGASALVLGTQVFVCGGQRGGRPTRAVWRFDPATGRLARAGHLPRPVAFAGSAVIGATGYLLGGESPRPAARVMTLRLVPDTAQH